MSAASQSAYHPYHAVLLYYLLFGGPIGAVIWWLLPSLLSLASTPPAAMLTGLLASIPMLLVCSIFAWLVGVIPATLTGLLVCAMRLQRGWIGTLASAICGGSVMLLLCLLPFLSGINLHNLGWLATCCGTGAFSAAVLSYWLPPAEEAGA